MGQSTLEKRRTAAALKKVNKIEAELGLPPSTVAVQGTQKFNWTDGATIGVSIFAGVFFAALLMGYVVAPGGVILVLGYNAVKPRRTIALSGASVTIWKQSAWSGSVKESLGTYPRSAISIGAWTTVADHPPVKLKGEEIAVLTAAQRQLGATGAPVDPSYIPPPPVEANPPLV